MSDANLDYHAARERVLKRMKKRQEFYSHLAWFIGVNLIFWVIWLLSSAAGFPWPVILTLVWGIGLVSDAIETFVQTNPNVQARREQALEREIAREQARSAENVAFEKPKRKRTARLAEDGELDYDGEPGAEVEDEPRRAVNRDS